MEIHEAAEIFPMMSDEQYKDLLDDIRENGCRSPVVTYKGQLLDGRNRAKACAELKIKLPTVVLDPKLVKDPVSWVLSTNLHRRHLTTSQRAMIAGRIATLKSGKPANNGSVIVPNGTITRNDAAEKLNVSVRTVSRAKEVIEGGAKEVVKAVEEGKLTVSQAKALVDSVPDKKEQKELVMEGKAAVKEAIETKKAEASVDPASARARRDIPDLVKKIRFHLGNLGIVQRYDTFLERMLEDVR